MKLTRNKYVQGHVCLLSELVGPSKGNLAHAERSQFALLLTITMESLKNKAHKIMLPGIEMFVLIQQGEVNIHLESNHSPFFFLKLQVSV